MPSTSGYNENLIRDPGWVETELDMSGVWYRQWIYTLTTDNLHHICLPFPLFLWLLGDLTDTVRRQAVAHIFMFHIILVLAWNLTHQFEKKSNNLKVPTSTTGLYKDSGIKVVLKSKKAFISTFKKVGALASLSLQQVLLPLHFAAHGAGIGC